MQSINAYALIDNAKLRGIHWRIILISALIIIFDGYDLIIYGVALPKLMAEWKIDTVTAGFLASIALFGMMFGAIIFGTLSDKLANFGISRKKSLPFVSYYLAALRYYVVMQKRPPHLLSFALWQGLA